VQCTYQQPGKITVHSNCGTEGGSGQGYTVATLTWPDGVRTTIKGNFISLEGWMMDGYPATVVEWPNARGPGKKSCIKSDKSGTVICWWRNTIEWMPVPGTNISSMMNPNPTPVLVGKNTLVRKGNQITFDADIDGRYIRYSGNCRTGGLYRLKMGSFDSEHRPRNIEPYPNERWFAANEFQLKILSSACSL